MDKKANMEYWDRMEDLTLCWVDILLNNYARPRIRLNGDARLDISKRMLDGFLKMLEEYEVDVDKAFPYVDCDY